MSFTSAIAASFSWRRVAIAEGYSIVLLLREWLGLDATDKFSRFMAAEVIAHVLAPLLVLLALGIAEEAVRRGARRIWVSGLAVLAASLLSSLIFTLLWFDMAWRTERSVFLFILEYAMQTALWASLAIVILDNSARTTRIRQSLKRAQMKRVQMERGVLEARLDAVRKQIDGPALFRELTEIRDGLQREEPQAAEALERLIQRLRNIQLTAPISHPSEGAI